MKCPNCSAKLRERNGKLFYCEYCDAEFSRSEILPGSIQAEQELKQQSQIIKEIHHYHEKPDKLSMGMGCLSFFFFPIGIIYFLINYQDYPKKAKAALMVAGVSILLVIIANIAGSLN